MNRLLRIAAVLLASSLLAGGGALAKDQGRGHGHDGGGWRPAEREWRGEHGGGREWRGGGGREWRGDRGPRDWRGDRGGREWRGDRGGPRDYRGPESYGAYPGGPGYPRRAPPDYGVRRGGMVPPQYRGAIVPDYGRHRLRPPPPGFAWVRMGDRYALVSRSTGQIFDVIGD